MGIYIYRSKERGKLSLVVFTSVSIVVFTVFIFNLLANYPGGISVDNVVQWRQVKSGDFNNWHPAIHTMIIWLVTRIVPNYSFFIGFQILVFSLLCGYLAATLYAWGIKMGWIMLVILTILAPRSTGGILLFAWKDTTLTILFLCLSVYMINIVFSDGKWLSKRHNASALTLVGALAIVRHNGFFFTLTLGLLMILFYRNITRKAIYVVAASVCIMLAITRILYPLADVTHHPTQTYIESVGLPMTVLSGVMANNPQALNSQTREFMRRFGTEEEFKTTFRLGNFNSIKWGGGLSVAAKFNEAPPPLSELLRMTNSTIKNDPHESLRQVIALTRMVWDPLNWNHNITAGVVPTAFGVVYTEYEIQDMKTALEGFVLPNLYIRSLIQFLFPHRILTSIGLHMLLLLIVGVYSINRNLKEKALILLLPSIAYNTGTMLLLSGPDYRFFHFNVVITFALVVALLAKVAPTPVERWEQKA